jgi:hypothetical protein
MPEDLYQRDILIWSEHEADLLRRLARGERVTGADWAHATEEEEVGFSERNAVRKLSASDARASVEGPRLAG